MARAVSTRSLIATHLRSGFLRFERAHKPQRERGKKFRGHSIAPSHRPSFTSRSAALTNNQDASMHFLEALFLSAKEADILRANQEAGFGN